MYMHDNIKSRQGKKENQLLGIMLPCV